MCIGHKGENGRRTLTVQRIGVSHPAQEEFKQEAHELTHKEPQTLVPEKVQEQTECKEKVWFRRKKNKYQI